MANWKIIVEDAKTALGILLLVIIISLAATFWIGFIILLIPISYIAGKCSIRNK